MSRSARRVRGGAGAGRAGSIGPIQRGAHTRARRASRRRARSRRSPWTSGAGLRMKPGICCCHRFGRGLREAGFDEVGVEEAEVGAADGTPCGATLEPQRVAQRLDARPSPRCRGPSSARARSPRAMRCSAGSRGCAAARDHCAVGPPHAEQVDRERALDLLDRRGRERAHVNAMPALATATSIAAEALDRPRDAVLQRLRSVTSTSSASARSPRRAAFSAQALRLEPDERDVRAPRVSRARRWPRRCRGPPR